MVPCSGHKKTRSTMNTSIMQLNLSDTSQPNDMQWKASAVLSIVLTTGGLTTNGFTIILFFANRSLWNPFNMYLINLTLGNILFYITAGGVDIIDNLYAVWWLPSSVCTVYLYGVFVATLMPIFIHPLISVVRVWALWAPVRYRNYHGYKTSVGLCLAAWLITHVVGLPGLLEDVLFHRKPEKEVGCMLDTASTGQMAYVLVIQFITLTALLTMVVAVPLIVYKEKLRRKVWVWAAPASTPQRRRTTDGMEEPGVIRSAMRQSGVRSRAPTDLLIIMTTSVVVLWGPAGFYFTLQPFYGFSYPLLENAVILLVNLQAVLDPVFFACAFKSLRTAGREMICCGARD